MDLKQRLNYWRRIFKVYFGHEKGYLSFWHEKPAVSEGIEPQKIGVYYMTFFDKANYDGPKDKDGIILFDYFFDIGRQYNPLSIAQYGLGHYNLYLKDKDKKHLAVAQIQADWLVNNLEKNDANLFVWKHKFPWHYKQHLESGWYSAHSQGTGISLLLRIYQETNDDKYIEACHRAFLSMNVDMKNGGVKYTDENNNVWLEEYVINPPTHIINGFLWALWGVWDYYVFTKDERALKLFNDCVATLKKNLPIYDAGFWSLYDLSKQAMKMVASEFYHSLHIVQLKIMFILTGEQIFDFYAKKFEGYQNSWFKSKRALIHKIIFKLIFF